MEKRSKDLLRALVKELRRIFVGTTLEDGRVKRGDLDRTLERIGIAPDGTVTPPDVVSNTRNGELRAYRIAAAQLLAIPQVQRAAARAEIAERAAYTWINRLLALRAMETRGLIDDTLRGAEAYNGLSEKLFILRQTEPARAAGDDGGWWAVLEDACNTQAKAIPGLFALDDPAAALRPSTAALLQAIELVNGSKQSGFSPTESDAAFRDPDAIGWAYQFYQEEPKQQIDAKCKKGGKVVNRSEIAAKTQLFTEPYMVQWLLQNSLGRSYAETYPKSTLPDTWTYYVKPEQPNAAPAFSLASLTLLDPCMGSGHFLRAAFDLFVAMYCEQCPSFTAKEIADRILSNHLHGIDLDPRAAQLTALSLYLRAWELVRTENRMADYTPPTMNLATTPTNLNKGILQRHIERYPRDMALKPLLEGIFSALEQAELLGSLLRPREYIEDAINTLKEDHNIPLDFNIEAAELRRTIFEISKHSPAELKQILFTTLLESFQREAGSTDDVSVALFGREAERGVRLLQLLDRRYALVVTNPPYLDSRNMDTLLKLYVKKQYPASKRDLYTAFILRCIELCEPNGRVAMVTQHKWLFLRSYVDLRAIPKQKLEKELKFDQFTGVLRETTIETLAHLGSNAFEEIGGQVVQSVLFTLLKRIADKEHRIVAYRLVGLKSAEEKKEMLRNVHRIYTNKVTFMPSQNNILTIPETPIVYWLSEYFFNLLKNSEHLEDIVDVKVGLQTGDNIRFTRCFWEVSKIGIVNDDKSTFGRWLWYAKGGHYQKWTGLIWLCLEWDHNGSRIKNFPSSVLRSPGFYFRKGLTYTLLAQGSFGARLLDKALFDVTGTSIFTIDNKPIQSIAALLSSHFVSYILRITTQDLKFNGGYVSNLILPTIIPVQLLTLISNACIMLKNQLVITDVTEHSFVKVLSEDNLFAIQIMLHSLEGLNEQVIISAYNVDKDDTQTIIEETGIPAGWYPLIADYDTLPTLPEDLELPPLPQELYDYLTNHKRIRPEARELARLRVNLKALYEAGPKAKDVEQQESEEPATESEGDEEAEGSMAAGAHIPIPTETFLEELSVKMELHPISVYWLLEELRAEGVRCKPEELRVLEDRLSVIILRLLGYRWPKQIEANEPVPAWAVADGIIPLVTGTGKTTPANLIRERLRKEEGDLGVQRIERLLTELTGQTLEEWLHKRFFSHHVSQFKSRPIAWHLASISTKGTGSSGKKKRGSGSSSRGPAFECLLYYHACAGDALARIRTQYVEPLIQAEHNASGSDDLFSGSEETATAIANERILELEAFVEKLRRIEEQGFACDELITSIETEPLDRWSGNGYVAPLSRDELLRNEAAWHVDINDGVRVNIAPLQLAGVLASDVLKTNDARKALADRAHWRADERRWVREGKLPRCGWMGEDVPESLRWQELHKQPLAVDANDTQEESQEVYTPHLLEVETEPEKGVNA